MTTSSSTAICQTAASTGPSLAQSFDITPENLRAFADSLERAAVPVLQAEHESYESPTLRDLREFFEQNETMTKEYFAEMATRKRRRRRERPYADGDDYLQLSQKLRAFALNLEVGRGIKNPEGSPQKS